MRVMLPMAWCAALALLLAGSGCATSGADAASTPYTQMGGAQGVEGIVDDLLEKILEDDRINVQFADTDIVRFREKLIEQLCVEAGGPCTYTGLSMQESHAGRDIDDAQFNALVEDLVAVMEARKVPIGAQNRLLKKLAPMHREIVAP